MKKLFLLLAIISVIGSGYKPLNSLHAGTYKYVKNNYFSMGIQYLHGVRIFYSGSTITINKDSTFLYTTCGKMMSGNWKTEGDSLFLMVKSSSFRGEKLKLKYGTPIISNTPEGFRIRGEFLEQETITKKGEKGMERLKFTGA
jgi:hypothetical protein